MIAALFVLFLSPGAWAQSVQIPEGDLQAFWVTAQDKKPVRIREFVAMRFPVTNEQFLQFLKDHPEWRKSRVSPVFADDSYLQDFRGDLKLKPGLAADAPVTHVPWFAAQAYCESAGMKLPDTGQWEYLAAASEEKADASRDPEFLNRILEWYSEPRPASGLRAVGQGKANHYGLHDLHGLVWEWVSDFNSNLVTGESREDGSLNRNLFCGAGAMGGGNKENYAAFMRFAFRASLRGKSTAWNLGFRCVREGKL